MKLWSSAEQSKEIANRPHPVTTVIRGSLILALSLGAGCKSEPEKKGKWWEKGEAAVIEHQSCFAGCPHGSPEVNMVADHEIFILSNNPRTKFADWVAYCVSKETLGAQKSGKKEEKKKKGKGEKKQENEREWKADPAIPSEYTLEPKDYQGASEALGIDRGHQAPFGHFHGTAFDQNTNFLSNITPQMKDLNQGPWNDLEKKERDLAKTYDEVCVVTGPLYEREMPKLPNADEIHEIPSAYWKVVIVRDTRAKIKSAAFIMDQEKSRKSKFCSDQVSIDHVEERSKLNLFPQLEEEEAAIVEARAKGELSQALGCGGKKTKKGK